MMQNVQARVDRNLDSMSKRLDSLQDVRDQQRLQGSQVSRQVPDMAQKIDQLWAQCQFYFSKVKEHDVHIGLGSTDFEKEQAVPRGQSSTLRLNAGEEPQGSAAWSNELLAFVDSTRSLSIPGIPQAFSTP